MKHNTLLLSVWLFVSSLQAVNYYVNPAGGSDSNSGTSAQQAFKHLQAISAVRLQAGDSVLLASAQVHEGSLKIVDAAGSKSRPVVVTTYSTKGLTPATINAKGCFSGIYIENCSHIIVCNLTVQANAGGMTDSADVRKGMRCGVVVNTSKSGIYEGITLKQLIVKDIFYENPGFVRGENEVKTANGKQRYGWGIRFINNTGDCLLKDLVVTQCEVRNVSHTGIKLTGKDHSIENIDVSYNRVTETGGPGIQMSGVSGGHIYNNTVDGSGSNNDSRKWGRGSGLWTWGSRNILIEKNNFLNANGPGDSAGAHIDFNCSNVVMQYNFSANNAGGFCEILGNNDHCAYRYNISVNDGYRVKGEHGAFQEGKLFWLSGYNGTKKPNGPFNSYFYNNTMYMKKEIATKMAIAQSASGICIVNNLFVIEGSSSEVKGDQLVSDNRAESQVMNTIFQNNLFANESNWPASILIRDKNPIFGDPMFMNKGGLSPKDYIPRNTKLISDKGIAVPKLPQDDTGLQIGLAVEKDFFGNPIKNRPDIGAIEITQ